MDIRYATQTLRNNKRSYPYGRKVSRVARVDAKRVLGDAQRWAVLGAQAVLRDQPGYRW